MIRQKLQTQNESGFILVTVIMMTIVLSVVVISIMSVNVSQVKSSQTVVDSIKAQQLALGTYFKYHELAFEAGTSQLPSSTPGYIILDGKKFYPTITQASTLDGPNQTREIIVEVGSYF